MHREERLRRKHDNVGVKGPRRRDRVRDVRAHLGDPVLCLFVALLGSFESAPCPVLPLLGDGGRRAVVGALR